MLCRAVLCHAVMCCAMLCCASQFCHCCVVHAGCRYWPAGHVEKGAHHDDALQEFHGLVNGGVGVKAGAAGGKLVVQDGLQLLCQAVSCLLQLGLLLLCGQSILLQLLVVPAPHPRPSSARVRKHLKPSKWNL